MSSDADGAAPQLQRAAAVGVAMAADIALNYPLWIAAKRVGMGIAAYPPTLGGFYKGAGSLWLSLGPTTILEDATKRRVEEVLPPGFPHHDLFSSVVAGAFAASVFCAQVEHFIGAAHATGLPMRDAVRHCYDTRGGAAGLLLPPGVAAVILREMPFVSALFWVQPRVAERIYDGGDRHGEAWRPHLELAAGLTTSALTCPFSHVPSVVAAYQQGHGGGLRQACEEIYRQGGLLGFWRGLGSRTLSVGGTMVVVPNVLAALGGGAHGA